MKVVLSVPGTFHHFDLARQLHGRGMLEAIFTGYPRWKLRQEQIPQSKIRTFPWVQTLMMGKFRMGMVHRKFDRQLEWLACEALDAHVASHLPECDVLVALSCAGLRTSREIRRRGTAYICDRASSHIRFAENMLSEEFSRWGQVFPGIHPKVIEKEEEEYGAADLITVPSEFCVRSFRRMGVPANKIRKIPYGVDPLRFRKLGDPPKDRLELLFVGQISFRKGIPYLLEAFRRLKHPRKRLRLVGAMQPEMREFLRHRKDEDVEYLGAVRQHRLPAIMSSSHAMILPSVEEGLAYVQGQAMACGCPVIATTNTGAEDLFSDGQEGFIVPIRDPGAVHARLQELADNPDLRLRMSEASMRRVGAIGGWEAYGSGFEEVCREVSTSLRSTWLPEASRTPSAFARRNVTARFEGGHVR